jgi:hypothetical protein
MHDQHAISLAGKFRYTNKPATSKAHSTTQFDIHYKVVLTFAISVTEDEKKLKDINMKCKKKTIHLFQIL